MTARERFSSTLDPTLNELGFSVAGRSPVAGSIYLVGDPLAAAQVAANAAAAAASEAAAEAALDDFRRRFLGAFSAAPTLDNEGNALQEGALYFNIVTGFMYARHGGGWAAAYAYGGSFPVAVATQSTGSMSINRTSTEYHRITLAATVTAVTLVGWPPDGEFGRIQLEIRNTGAFSISGWPASVRWVNGVPPSVTSGAGKKDIFVLWSTDGGTIVYGAIVGQNFT